MLTVYTRHTAKCPRRDEPTWRQCRCAKWIDGTLPGRAGRFRRSARTASWEKAEHLDLIFSQQFERTVDRDNTVGFHSLVLQIEPAEWRGTMTGCKVIIHQHLDATLTLTIGGHRVGHYSAQGKLLTPLTKKQVKAVEKTCGGKVKKK